MVDGPCRVLWTRDRFLFRKYVFMNTASLFIFVVVDSRTTPDADDVNSELDVQEVAIEDDWTSVTFLRYSSELDDQVGSPHLNILQTNNPIEMTRINYTPWMHLPNSYCCNYFSTFGRNVLCSQVSYSGRASASWGNCFHSVVVSSSYG